MNKHTDNRISKRVTFISPTPSILETPETSHNDTDLPPKDVQDLIDSTGPDKSSPHPFDSYSDVSDDDIWITLVTE